MSIYLDNAIATGVLAMKLGNIIARKCEIWSNKIAVYKRTYLLLTLQSEMPEQLIAMGNTIAKVTAFACNFFQELLGYFFQGSDIEAFFFYFEQVKS